MKKYKISNISSGLIYLLEYITYTCQICLEDVRESDIECNGPRHGLKVKPKEKPVEDIQIATCGAYVDPKTGKIVKAKALNNPVMLG